MSVAGRWNVTMNTPLGVQEFIWDLEHSAAGWTGIMDARTGKADLRNITLAGDVVSFDTRIASPMGPLDLAFSGAVNGSQISGACKTAFGDTQFTAQRG